MITRQAVIGCYIYRTSSASDTAASMITDQDVAAPATPSTAGGLKDKRNIISVILKRIFNRKYFKVKFLLYCSFKYTALSYIASPFLLHGIS